MRIELNEHVFFSRPSLVNKPVYSSSNVLRTWKSKVFSFPCCLLCFLIEFRLFLFQVASSTFSLNTCSKKANISFEITRSLNVSEQVNIKMGGMGRCTDGHVGVLGLSMNGPSGVRVEVYTPLSYFSELLKRSGELMQATSSLDMF